MLEHRSSKELTSEVQAHLRNKMVDPVILDWDHDLQRLIEKCERGDVFVPFSLLNVRSELQGMRCKSAVGPDLIGVHLLREVASPRLPWTPTS